ncbi:hypothetical protein BGX26_008802 [Mortierella sp. AD094]|nr:hypothetical protein BGX26_008802 [Mortierella sp. AD094]
MSFTLFCLVNGEPTSNVFSVKIHSTENVDSLKKLIKAEKSPEFNDIAADKLTLWRVMVPVVAATKHNAVLIDAIDDKEELLPTDELSDIFSETPEKKKVHIMVERPLRVIMPTPSFVPTIALPQSRPSTPLSAFYSNKVYALSAERWLTPSPDPHNGSVENIMQDIMKQFFASGASESGYLTKYAQGEFVLPTTEEPFSGLPCIKSRGAARSSIRPTLLFLGLTDPRVKSPLHSAANLAIETINSRSLSIMPFFGVSGCGKTRTVLEMLSEHWGFYFNGSRNDWGSQDLTSLVTKTMAESRYRTKDKESNAHVKILTLALILSRIEVLLYCLLVPGSEDTFSTHRWMLLQACPTTFSGIDVFVNLFGIITDAITRFRRTIDYEDMANYVRGRFRVLRTALQGRTAVTSHNFESYRILFVIDEAQALGKMELGEFISETTQPKTRPLLSPLLHGFEQIDDNGLHYCVVPCGTGLSNFDLDWLLDSNPLSKKQDPADHKFTTFSDWENEDQIRSYINFICSPLTSKTAAKSLHNLIPTAAIKMLFELLRGRFRPIISTIEDIISNPDKGWEQLIQQSFTELTTAKEERLGGGNICNEIRRVLEAVRNNKERYKDYSDVEFVMRMFTTCQGIYGHGMVIDFSEAPLVEASIGRFITIEGKVQTVMDEPFVFEAVKNYFMEFDKGFSTTMNHISAFTMDHPSRGVIWELNSLQHLKKIFNRQPEDPNIPLSLFPNGEYPHAAFRKRVTLYGAGSRTAESINSQEITLDAFLDGHIHNNSKRQDGSDLPPFYQPNHYMGPDVVFVLKFGESDYCPVFSQLKLTVDLKGKELEKALQSIHATSIEPYVRKEAQAFLENTIGKKQAKDIIKDTEKFDLSNYTSFGVYISILQTYPTILPDNTFTKTARRDGEGAKQVLLKIDGSNIEELFSSDHMRTLKRMREYERSSEIERNPLIPNKRTKPKQTIA